MRIPTKSKQEGFEINVDNLTNLLKKSTSIKNETGCIAAIDYLKGLIIENDLREKDALRCCKKIMSLICDEKSITIKDATFFFLETLQNRISKNEFRYELYFSLSQFYFDKNQFDLSFKMINGALSSTNPNDFLYLHYLRNCYIKMAEIVRVSRYDERAKSLDYLFRVTAACLFEIASEINSSLMEKLKSYFSYREEDFSKNYYLNDESGYFNSALNKLGLIDKKKEFVDSIREFAIYDIPKKMGFSERLLAGDTKAFRREDTTYFTDETMIIDFAKKLYAENKKIKTPPSIGEDSNRDQISSK